MPYQKGMVRQYGGELNLIHRILDAVIILGALSVCGRVYGVELGLEYAMAGMIAVFGFMFFAEWHVLYGSWRADSMGREAWSILSIWVLAFCVLLALGFLSKLSIHFSRVTMLAWALTTPILLGGERLLIRYLLRHVRKLGFNSRSVAIIGSGRSVSQLVDAIMSSPWMGMHIEGVYDELDGTQNQLSNFQFRDIETLFQRVQAGEIDSVFIAYPMQQEEKIRRLVESLADSTVSVHVVPDVFVSELLHARWTSVGEIPLVSVFESPFYGSNLFLKRMEDLILGSFILLLISPLMIAISVMVKVTSPGPVIFKQRRYGLDGAVIEVWKFRSMSVLEDGPNVPQAQKNDPRITPLGAFLRRTSLDELPQFINVLQGRMSIVGPRPHAIAHNEQYRKMIYGYMLRHKVKPGITGWAQVNGWRGETDTIEKMEMRVKYDLDYFNNWSIWFDLKIILMTIFGGMRGKNAY